MTTIKEALVWATKSLKKTSESPSLDADVLLTHVIGESKAFLYGHPDSVIKAKEEDAFRALVKRRANQEPIAYLTGEKEFYGLPFQVNSDVLVPRPATEHLVDAVLDEFNNHPVTVADIGTGSGAVAIALKSRAPKMHVIATDISKEAIDIAKGNAKQNDVTISFSRGDLTDPLKSNVDGIVANLPYLTTEEMANPSISHEPEGALLGGDDGLEVFRRFFPRAKKVLKPEGVIFLEIGAKQAEDIRELALKTFPDAGISVSKDLAGFDRVVTIRKKDTTKKPQPKARLTALRNFLGQG